MSWHHLTCPRWACTAFSTCCQCLGNKCWICPAAERKNVIWIPAGIPGEADARRAWALLFHSVQQSEQYRGAGRAAFATEDTWQDFNLALRHGASRLITPSYNTMKTHRGKFSPWELLMEILPWTCLDRATMCQTGEGGLRRALAEAPPCRMPSVARCPAHLPSPPPRWNRVACADTSKHIENQKAEAAQQLRCSVPLHITENNSLHPQ